MADSLQRELGGMSGEDASLMVWWLIFLENLPGMVWEDEFGMRCWRRSLRDRGYLTGGYSPIITDLGEEQILQNAHIALETVKPEGEVWKYRDLILRYIPLSEWATVLTKMTPHARKVWAAEARRFYARTKMPIKVLTP